MNKTLLTASALVVTALLSSPVSADVDHKTYGHKEGEFCSCATGSQCDDTQNALWLCKGVIDPHKKPDDPSICAWKSGGVCTNNLNPGEDINKNADKEKANAEARRKRNEKNAADEKAAEKAAADKAAADDKKKTGDKKAPDDKKKADEKKAPDDKKKVTEDKKGADKNAADAKKAAADKVAADKKAAADKAAKDKKDKDSKK
jgi:hypothetical protein